MNPTLSKTLFFLRRYGLSSLLLAVIAYQVAFTWIPVWVSASRLEGTDVSHLSLLDDRGRVVAISDFRGAPLILNFWATWCLPCKLEIPQLADAYPDLKAQGKRLVGVNFGESWPVINAFRKETHIPYPVLLDPGKTARALGVNLIPALVVINSEGRVDKIVYGYRPWVKWYLLWWI